ncbi:MAG: hypothetical protein COB67_03045 [SAR324 cluster bacterium]|uniref:Uncharacterized protein n=1 Tax=SAR324 cluster bacterium TaxID=2024889 RepID=A0A2A4T8Q7_9DELT|nr:MAG: hypothetical protein COB67_03045 [SAR324 cluster bacterium]
MKKLLFLILLVGIAVAGIKYVEPVKDMARNYLPAQVLELIGETPKGILERGMDQIKDKTQELLNQ